MNKLHDPELELFKRTIDLADYAKRAGYELRPQDGAPGLTVLDHPNRDRIVVGQHPNGLRVYASVPDYVPRAPSEPAEQALARLRSAIDRSKDKGTIVEFVQQRDPLARRGGVALDQIRDRLLTFRATGLPLDFEGALSPPPYPRGRELAIETRAAAFGRIGRSQIRPGPPPLRLEHARRERSAGDGGGAPAPGVARGPRGDRKAAARRARSPAAQPAGSAARSASEGPWPTDSRAPTHRSWRHDLEPGQVGARASTLRLDPSADGPRRDCSRASRALWGERAMKTAVQLHTFAKDERPRAELLLGTPCGLGEGRLGPVARFESGQVVAYQIRSRRRRHLFVFRTLEVDDTFAVAVPSVRPRVQLLMELRTAGRIRLVRSLFAYLTRTGRDPSALPDAFYARLGAMLGGRLPGHKILPSLLSAYGQKPKRARANRTPRRGLQGAER